MGLLESVESAIDDFVKVSSLAGLQVSSEAFRIILLSAPHRPVALPKGKMAAYIFSHNSHILKIGIVGKKSGPRFLSQHYNPNSSQSNLAKSLLGDSEFTSRYNYNENNIGDWIKTNCDRINILIGEAKGMPLLRLLEAFLHVKFLPRYER